MRAYHSVRWILLISLPLLALSCSSPYTPKEPSDVEISLTRWGCFGTCPSYRVTIFGDGTVEYEGFFYVNVQGMVEASITQEKIGALLDAFEQLDFFNLPDEYTSMLTDGATYETTLRIGKKEKTVSRYICGPTELMDLEHMIDDIVGTERWTGQKIEKFYPDERTCPKPYGTFNSPLETPQKRSFWNRLLSPDAQEQ